MTIMLSYRKATIEDSQFLLKLRMLTMVEHLDNAEIFYSEKQHLERVKEFFNDSQIILLNDNPIGLLKLAVFHDRLHIRQFQIMPKVQGNGIGSQVLKDVIKRATQRQLSISLNVLLANPAKELYLRTGFVVVGGNEFECQMHYKLVKNNIISAT